MKIMTDSERILTELEDWKQCGYAEMFPFYYPILDDVIELLKEQKTVLHRQSRKELSSGSTMVTGVYLCPWCKEIISIGFADDDYHFCPYCGRGIKWDD